MIRLPFRVIEENMGAQYHHFLLGILFADRENWGFVFNHYLEMEVKHFFDSHGDFAFEGIYAAGENLMQQMILRGPVRNFRKLVKECLKNDAYVVVNINEKNLPDRQAYHKRDFRHDILIYGVDEEDKTYITAGFDAGMNFCETEYFYEQLEYAYETLQNEWDYELFIFRMKKDFSEEPDWKRIEQHLKRFLNGTTEGMENVMRFLQGEHVMFCQMESYKEYYGIGLYDYLCDRLRGYCSMFQHASNREKINVNDVKTIIALHAHAGILKRLFARYPGKTEKEKEQLQEETEKLQKKLYVIRLLFIKCREQPDKKKAKNLIHHLQEAKEDELRILTGAVSGYE